ncbi:ankyrin repeat domain-containing protein [Aspergillus ibericus CBS 121593]|uniref:Ankyrin n=1 Tax=Aspergillus ibericus CBS 121593 TaxID=1448316 RepID=A0A395GK84_9EURO|nr:ankyrin [Aspergillus ibericus CBS 121593]RAK95879.1 ankyrin [Aspergillus ibericus CBS 121593]
MFDDIINGAVYPDDKRVLSSVFDNVALPLNNDRSLEILDKAARTGNVNMVELLLEKYPEFECNLESLMLDAAQEDQDGLVSLLLSKGVDPNCKCPEEQISALSYAGMFGCLRTIKVLLAAGANMIDHDKWGDTPIWYAETYGHQTVLDAYEEHDPESYADHVHTESEMRMQM